MTSYPLSQEQIHKVALPVIGRQVHPSEREIACWGKGITTLQELLGTDFQNGAFSRKVPKKAFEALLEAILKGVIENPNKGPGLAKSGGFSIPGWQLLLK